MVFFSSSRQGCSDTGLRLYIHPAVGNHPPLICWYSVNRSGPRLGQGASLVAQTVKNLPRCQRCGFDPWVGKIPWRRKWQPTPVFLSGESCGQRSLEGYTVHGVAKSQTRLQWLSMLVYIYTTLCAYKYIYRILLSHKKYLNNAICKNTDTTRD